MRAEAIVHRGPRQVSVESVDLPEPGPEQLLLEAEYSAISPGTESLIFQGRVPADLPLDDTLGSLSGTFRYPFRYGYAWVGRVAKMGPGVSDDWRDRRVFLFHPHQSRVIAHVSECRPIPGDVSSQAALFVPNLESALNLVMDGAPLVGERVMVLGQGVVGLLLTAILSRLPLERLVTADPLDHRRELSVTRGAETSLHPADDAALSKLKDELFRGETGDGFDLIFEVSGNMQALNLALDLAGFAARILIGSWYGLAAAPVNLGGAFHRRRIRLISSQVSTLSPELSGRWSKERRLSRVWDWIRQINPESLITDIFPLAQCHAAFERNIAPSGNVLQTIFRY